MRIAVAFAGSVALLLTLGLFVRADGVNDLPPSTTQPAINPLGAGGIPSSAAMDPAFPTSNTEHLRLDADQLAKRGDGSVEKGMTALGKAGYRLFLVTTAGADGTSGWHIFKRPRWNMPVPRPRFEYRRLDDAAIAKLGNGNFDDGLTKFERDGFDLVAVTTSKNGGIGFYYFERVIE